MLTIYKASAGSGKTFALAYEYIKMLLGLKDRETGRYTLNSDKYSPSGHRFVRRHSALLAITFTNDATDEMKKRIIGHLDALSGRNPQNVSDYEPMLISEFGCTADELHKAAEKALSELLYDYNAFNVSTIDSFFQTVLRTFAREIDHQGDYELTLNSEDAIRQAMSLALDELNYTAHTPVSKRLLAWIETLVMGNMAEGGNYNFFNRQGSLLNGLAKSMNFAMNETYYAHSDAIDAYLAEPANIRGFRKELIQRINSAFNTVEGAARRLRDFCSSMGTDTSLFKSIGSRIDAICEGRALKPDDLKIKAFAKDAEFTAKAFFTAANIKKFGAATLETALPDIQIFCEELPQAMRRQVFLKQLVEATDLLEFIGIARRKLDEFLREGNQVLISDTGELLSRIISDAEMPFIYERMGMKLSNLFIDEFQDTSSLQWHNLKPLVANSLASGNDCLIIGDEKQAIYRFRNSDSEILGSQVQNVDFPDNHILRGHELKDNTNRRSAADIVRFNNALFSSDTLFSTIGIDKHHYRNVVQGIAPKKEHLPAYIKLHFSINDNPLAILEETAQDILAQHSRGYRWRDILILVRTRTEAKAVVEFLTGMHPEIELLSSEALLLSSSASVRAIVSMLKLVSRSYAGKNATKGDNAPVYASRSDIALMITRFNHYSSEGLDDDAALRMALNESTDSTAPLRERIDEIRNENPANLVALIEAVIAHRLTPDMRSREYAYIAAFQDLAIKHLESADPSLASFLAAYDRNESEWAIKAPADLDAVQVMTIHRSKGLERDCVHLPFADWELYHSSNSLWVPTDGLVSMYGFEADLVPPVLRVDVGSDSPLADEHISPFHATISADRNAEIIDNLNVTYVAFTRAGRELIAHVRLNRKNSARAIGLPIEKTFVEIVERGELPFRRELPDMEGEEETSADERYFILGEPTKPEYKPQSVDADVVGAGEYEVHFHDETRKIVSINDIFAEDDENGTEEPSEITDPVTPFSTPEMVEAARRGTNMHDILASMETLADLDYAVDRIAARNDLDKSEADEYRSIIRRAFENAAGVAEEWFSEDNTVFAERSFYNPHYKRPRRPDRVVFRPDGSVVIVDYKFTTEHRSGHNSQVEVYKSLIRTLGYASVEAFLWYPLLNKIIKV